MPVGGLTNKMECWGIEGPAGHSQEDRRSWGTVCLWNLYKSPATTAGVGWDGETGRTCQLSWSEKIGLLGTGARKEYFLEAPARAKGTVAGGLGPPQGRKPEVSEPLLTPDPRLRGQKIGSHVHTCPQQLTRMTWPPHLRESTPQD